METWRAVDTLRMRIFPSGKPPDLCFPYPCRRFQGQALIGSRQRHPKMNESTLGGAFSRPPLQTSGIIERQHHHARNDMLSSSWPLTYLYQVSKKSLLFCILQRRRKHVSHICKLM